MSTTSSKRRRIAILEDDPTNRDRLADLVQASGFDPLAVTPQAPARADLEAFLDHERISMVVCDHRLFDRGRYADYTGAAAVAASYRTGRGGVLVTAYESDDAESTIREYRRWIPALVHATELRGNTLKSALLGADDEAKGRRLTPQRTPYRAIMTVKEVIPKGDKAIVKVIMGQWDPNVEVGFPLRMLPTEMRAATSPGSMLIAQVNIDAQRSEDLFFDQFEVPDPDVLQKSRAFFDHP